MVKIKLGTFLYNLAEDPGETTDLSQKHPEIVKRLKAYYQTWNKKIKQGL